ncbi:MAG: hypothetical protein ACRCX4_12700 [Bacteroidales bacterium]
MTTINQANKDQADTVLLSVLHDKENLTKTSDMEILRFRKSILNYHRTIFFKPISLSARFLFFCILRRMLRICHAPIFFINDEIMESETGLTRNTLSDARAELVKLRLIDFSPGDHALSIKSMYKLYE